MQNDILTAKLITYQAGYGRQSEHVKSVLQLGDEYAVTKLVAYSWCSDVYLEGFEESFNSVFFEFYLNGQYVDFDDLIWMDDAPSCVVNTYKGVVS